MVTMPFALVFGPRADSDGACDVGASRDPDEDALFTREAPCHRVRLVIGDRDDLVDEITLKVLRHEPGTDP